MLVLSRRVNEALVIGDRFILTLARLSFDLAELALLDMDSGADKSFALRSGEAKDIGQDVTVSLIEIREDRARLGLEAPASLAVHRKEVSDAV